jgi:superfamily II DNA or RNA helicase
MLRPYQSQCLQAIDNAFKNPNSRALVVMPTGTGKTHVFANVIKNWDFNKGKVLVLAHREELVFQAESKISHALDMGFWGEQNVLIEMGKLKAVTGASWASAPKCVVASVASLHEKRLAKFNSKEFGLVVIDEAHHAVKKNRTYYKVLEYFGLDNGLQVLGVTATPDRGDEEALGTVFNSVPFQYPILQAISDGFLVPVKQELVQVQDLDFSNVKISAGDLSAGQLNDILKQEEMAHRIVSPTIEIVGEKKTLVFTAGVEQAQKTAEIFNRHKPDSAICIVGKTDRQERRDLLKEYSEGKYQFLVGCGVFTEGFDEPTIQAVVVARPTRSRALYTQMVGRGTRILPSVIEGVGEPPDKFGVEVEGDYWRISTSEERKLAISQCDKPEVMVIDFVGNAGKHKLMYTGEILGGNYSPEVIEKAKEIITEKPEGVEIDEALMEAHQILREEKQRQLKDIIVKTQYTKKPVDPFDAFDLPSKGGGPPWEAKKPPTDKMVQFVKRSGVPVIRDMGQWYIGEPRKRKEWVKLTYYKCKHVIAELSKRKKEGKCSYKQACLLKKFGEDPNMSFTDARKVIDQIASNGWKPLEETIKKKLGIED